MFVTCRAAGSSVLSHRRPRAEGGRQPRAVAAGAGPAGEVEVSVASAMAPGAAGSRGPAGSTGAPGQERGGPPSPPAMLLRESPFPNRALVALDYLARGLLAPSFWATNRLLDLRPTTAERRRGRCRGCTGRALAGLAYGAVLVLSVPVAALGLLLWLPVQAARRPFAYRYTAGAAAAEPWDLRQRRTFTFLSANVCLLPSGLAKFSNLGHTPQRAAYLARHLAPAPPRPPGDRAGLVQPWHGQANSYGGTLCAPRPPVEVPGDDVPAEVPVKVPVPAEVPVKVLVDVPAEVPVDTLADTPVDTPADTPVEVPGDTPVDTPVEVPGDTPVDTPVEVPGDTPVDTPVEVPGDTPVDTPVDVPAEVPAEAAEPVLSERFPADADFVCLQEVFGAGAAAGLCRRLGGTFPHVLSEVGARGLRGGRLKLLDSGLLLASRYPLLAARFHGYPNGAREDALAAKGLLLVQVLLGSAQGQRVVGYLGCTHLQAPAGDGAIRDAQLTLGLRWLRLFREAQERRGDVVAFDVLCGDLNFDNCSRGDELNQRHRLFEVYRDPCRRAPGRDAPWAIGTLLNCLKIYEEPVSTPEKMKRTLSQPGGRQQFLAGPILPNGQPDPAVPGPWQGRRVDYILYRQHRGARPLRTEVAGVSFVTQLATRSDHLPVVLQLAVAPAPP